MNNQRRTPHQILMISDRSQNVMGDRLKTTKHSKSILDIVHLNRGDLELVELFFYHISGPPTDDKLEEKLFDIICFDFGASIFLQHHKILQVFYLMQQLIDGIAQPFTPRFDRNLNYLSDISKEWHQCFRSTTSQIGLQFIAKNDAASLSSEGETRFLPLEQASNAIFFQLVYLLGVENYRCMVFSILNRIMPFVKLYLENFLASSAHDISIETILHYLKTAVHQLHDSRSHQDELQHQVFVLQVLSFVFDIFSLFKNLATVSRIKIEFQLAGIKVGGNFNRTERCRVFHDADMQSGTRKKSGDRIFIDFGKYESFAQAALLSWLNNVCTRQGRI